MEITKELKEVFEGILDNRPFPRNGDAQLLQLMFAAYTLGQRGRWVSVETPPTEVEEILMSHIDDKWISKGYMERGSYYNSYDHDCECYPTHWMILPNLPNTKP